MDDDEALYYSEDQLDVIREMGDDAGVVLLDGDATPKLYTDKLSYNPSMRSCWKDAVQFYHGSSCKQKFQILVDDTKEMTPNGEAFCKARGIEATPQALRNISLKPE